MRKYIVYSLIAMIVIAIIVAISLVYLNKLSQRPLLPPNLKQIVKGAACTLVVRSTYSNWSTIPRDYTCLGPNVSPPIEISNIPEGTKCLTIIMYDPDAPRGIFYHWLLYNIATKNSSRIYISPAIPPEAYTSIGMQGINDFGKIGYGGPCPPPREGHRYVLLVLALRSCLNLGPGVRPVDVLKALEGKVLSYGILVGIFKR